jgi:hypothetical protein
MLRAEYLQKGSLKELLHKNYADGKRILELYDKWDVAARSKDFHQAEHYEYMIKKIHDRNGLKET